MQSSTEIKNIEPASESDTEQETKTDRELQLENSEDPFTVEWIRNRNQETTEAFAESPLFKKLNAEALSCKIANPPSFNKGYLYDFFKEDETSLGIWRRITLEEYRKQNGKWETLLDMNALLDEEKWRALVDPELHLNESDEHWVFNGAIHCPSSSNMLIQLSLGKSDEIIYREFDGEKKEFVKNGFEIYEGNFSPLCIKWCDSNSLWLVTPFIHIDLAKKNEWHYQLVCLTRGESLMQAKKIYNAGSTLYAIETYYTNTHSYLLAHKSLSSLDNKWILIDKNESGTPIPIPCDANLDDFFGTQLIITIRCDWKITSELTYKAGSVISVEITSITDPALLKTALIFEPTDLCTVRKVKSTKNHVLILLLNDVSAEIHQFKFKDDKWISTCLPLPKMGKIKIISDCLVSYESFITPYTLYHYDDETNSLEALNVSPSYFDAENFQVTQYKATSQDGTKIPYYIVHPKNMNLDGENATLLTGYGGFGDARLPYYLGATGKIWLSEGGTFVLANIRGGGEYGSKWHQAAVKENRHKSYEDFLAVAADLITRKITSPKHLGITGGSNGGLLVGVALTKKPELFNAAISDGGLLDMVNYSVLNPWGGCDWQNEYGDPKDKKMRQYIKSDSPYDNLSRDKHYPAAFFFSATNDVIVNPAHSRKFADKIKNMNHSVFYYEHSAGGHRRRGYPTSFAFQNALIYSFLKRQLVDNKQELTIEEFKMLGMVLEYLLGDKPSEIITSYLAAPYRR